VRVAQASRGHSAKNPVPLVIPFLHSVMRKARNFSISLDSRAFDPEKTEIPYKLKMKLMDWFSLVVLVLIVYVRLYYFFG
jgi:energy-coupling factor transporter transmembrane protein EcfT